MTTGDKVKDLLERLKDRYGMFFSLTWGANGWYVFKKGNSTSEKDWSGRNLVKVLEEALNDKT